MSKLGQHPAFANNNTNGMSKRFYAACAAMQGMLVDYRHGDNETVIKTAYELADELLKQEEL